MTIALHQPEQVDAPPVLDDRYRCVDVIGHGRHATVWRAVDQRLGRQVAVKIFRTSAGVHAAGARASVEAMARLAHPNIVRMFDGGRRAESTSRRSYLVLELVAGWPLSLTRSRLSADEVAGIGVALAGALAYIHGHGAVHADIRPSNILLPSNGQGTVPWPPKLCELQMFDTVDSEYAAPEQHHGEVATTAGDIYSLGMVLGEVMASCERRLGDLHLMDLFVPDLDAQWQGLCARMCDADPAERPSATEVAVQLTGLLSAQAGETRGSDRAGGASHVRRGPFTCGGLGRRAARFLRPNRVAVADGIAFADPYVVAGSSTFARVPHIGGDPVTDRGDLA